MYKVYGIGALVGVAIVVAIFFFGRGTGKDAMIVKTQKVELDTAKAVNNVQQEVIKNRPLNSSELINRLRARARAKRSDSL